MKKLIIAEKPDLGRAIADAIPGEKKDLTNRIEVEDYAVTWAVGHILRYKTPDEVDEKYKNWNIEDLPIYFEKWDKIPIEGKETLLNNIKGLLKNADEVIHAGDPDDEGQYLIDEILEYCNYRGNVKRILINDNNIEAVRRAFKKIESNQKFVSWGKAAEARAISDMVVGFNLSRFFTLYNNSKKLLTIGRVQTPILSLVVNRDYEIKNHIKEKYYELFLKTDIEDKEIKLRYINQDKENKLILDKSVVENIVNEVKNRKEKIQITKKQGYAAIPLPFDLTKLQIEAGTRFGYSSKKTQDITQNLRDKYKAITYNRTNSQYLTEEHFKQAPKLIPVILEKLGLKNLKVDFSEENKSKCFNDVNAPVHHGIIPTFSGNISEFNIEERNIYELIARRYIIQFMEKEKVEKTEAILKIDDKIFKATALKTIELGYTAFYKEENEEAAREKEKNPLSEINPGEYTTILSADKMIIEEKETTPKKAYTEPSLMKDISNIAKYVKNDKIKAILKEKDKNVKGENGSIGTSATRATIVAELFKKGYLENKGKSIVSTELAREYLATLPEKLKSPDTTAAWWVLQEEIKEGKSKKERLINYVLKDVKAIIESDHKKVETKVIEDNKEIIGKCPTCGSFIHENQKSYYCSNYKEGCKFNLWKDSRYFDQTLKITKEKAKKLLKGEKAKFKLKSKTGNDYEAYFTIEINKDYVNLKRGDFVGSKKKRK